MGSFDTLNEQERDTRTGPREESQGRPKLSREDVLRMVEENGGPESLDLSGYDLSQVNLSDLDLRGVVFGTDWRTPHLSTACLRGALLIGADLEDANFVHADLSGADFFGSNLQNAVLGITNCTDTSFRRANLQGANFHWARFDNTDFTLADLRGSDFHSAHIGDIDLTNAKIGNQLVFENLEKYHAFLRRHRVEEQTIHK